MIFPNEQDWNKWSIDAELHKFFLLRWQEIFDENTFDSWQVRSCNLKTILLEMIEALNIVDKVHIFHPNIKILIEEAKQIASEDKIIAEFFPYIVEYVKKLDTTYEQNIKNENSKNAESFRKILNVMIGNLHHYRNKLESKIKELISNPPEKYKIELYSLAMALGIELKSIGYSILALRESYKLLTDTRNGSFLERFIKLTTQFSGNEISYTCYFMISWHGDIPLLEGDIELTKEHPKNLLSDEEKEFYNQDSEAVVAKISIMALDHYSARVKAEKILQSLFDLSMLYKPTKITTIKHKKSLITDDNNHAKKCIGVDSSNLKYIRDSKNVKEDISEYWKLHKNLTPRDVSQLSASLQYHKLALLSNTDESKIINLWIAVESLVQEGGKNIIDRICKYIPTSNAIGYIYLMMKAIPIDIREMWRKSNTQALCSKLSKSNKYILHPSDLLNILLDKKDGELITEFRNLINDNPLSVYRIYSLWKDVFEKPEILAEKLERHRKNIEWQIRRIYRARNYAMHNGICHPRTRQLIQHLRSYYIITIHNLIHDLKINSEWSISDALEHRFYLYTYFYDRLKESNDKKLSIEALFNPYLVLFDSGKNSAWDAKKK